MSTIDLHIHSNKSNDGDFTPKDLMQMCAEAGLKVVSLADHNSTRGLAEAEQYAQEIGLEFIPGIEMDCDYQGTILHLLGYWVDADAPIYQEIESSVIATEAKASITRIRKTEELGIVLDREKLDGLAVDGVVTGEMIAEVALACPQNQKNPLLLPYRKGGKRSDNPFVNFYYDYFSKGKLAYAPMEFIDLSEAVSIVRRTGGVPILAHPGISVGIDSRKLEKIISMGIDGIEAYSSYHNPETTAFFLAQASLLNIAVTCGSDFHGKTKPSLELGGVSCFNHEADIMKKLKSLKST